MLSALPQPRFGLGTLTTEYFVGLKLFLSGDRELPHEAHIVVSLPIPERAPRSSPATMQALRRRTAHAIAQVERRQKLEYKKKSALLRRERLYKERHRNEIERKNRALVKQEVWEKWRLGELQSREGWLNGQRRDMPKEMAPSRSEMKEARKMEVLQERLRTTGEALLVEKEERRKSPEYNVAVSAWNAANRVTRVMGDS